MQASVSVEANAGFHSSVLLSKIRSVFKIAVIYDMGRLKNTKRVGIITHKSILHSISSYS